MKIAVAAQQAGMTAAVDQRFGRAPWFVVVDTESNTTRDINNGVSLNQAHGAGTGAADLLMREHVQVVVAGNFGPKAQAVFQSAGVETVSWSQGTVADAVAFVREHHAKS